MNTTTKPDRTSVRDDGRVAGGSVDRRRWVPVAEQWRPGRPARHRRPVYAARTAMVKPVTDKDFRGKYMLVYFGYTFCPDVCPTTLNAVADAMDKLGPAAASIQPLFITVDPKAGYAGGGQAIRGGVRPQDRGPDRDAGGDCRQWQRNIGFITPSIVPVLGQTTTRWTTAPCFILWARMAGLSRPCGRISRATRSPAI